MSNNRLLRRSLVSGIVLLTLVVSVVWYSTSKVYAAQSAYQVPSRETNTTDLMIQVFLPMVVVEKGGITDSIVVINQASMPTPTPTAIVTLQPLSTATPDFGEWKTAYFSNPTLSGLPVKIENAPTLNFNWGDRSPAAGMPADGFSVRFERVFTWQPGFYRLLVSADDGVRVFVNDELVINAWSGATGLTYTAERALSGAVTLRVEYFEASGLAFVAFGYEYLGESATWSATYFTNTNLSGGPILSQSEPRTHLYHLDHNWQMVSPVASEKWSARWVGHFPFERGDYIFYVRANGGVRVYLNEYCLVDAWTEGYNEKTNTFIGVGGETHTITVEYWGRQGIGSLQVWWQRR